MAGVSRRSAGSGDDGVHLSRGGPPRASSVFPALIVRRSVSPTLGSPAKGAVCHSAHILLLRCLASHSGHGHRDCLCGGCRRRDPDEHPVLGLREEKVRSAVTPPGHWAATESALLPINESHPRVHNWLKMFWFCFCVASGPI